MSIKGQEDSRTVFHSYSSASAYEQKKLEENYRRLEEYEWFYVYGKYDNNGNLLYRECFSKYDVDGSPTHQRIKRAYNRREF